MNQKRDYVASIEKNYGLSVRVEGDLNLVTPEYSIEKLKSATRILTENEPALVTADGLMEISEEVATDDLKDEDERPKKRRRRRRKKKPFSNEEDVNLQVENMEEQATSHNNLIETFSLSENVSNAKSDTSKKDNRRRRSKKADNLEANSTNSSEEVLDLENGKLKQQDATDNENTEVEPKNVKQEKKRSPKKRTEKKAAENTDNKDKEDNEENSKQKRKGWWSLKG